MIDKRLLAAVKESKKYIAGNVACQWAALAANIAMVAAIARLLSQLYTRAADLSAVLAALGIAVLSGAVRFCCTLLSSKLSYLSSRAVKQNLRSLIYKKLLRLGASYREQVNTSEVVQVAVEGVDQLETYFGAYLPQLFYAMLAPLTLFGVLSTVSVLSASALVVCVPLIPVAIVAVQRWAKKLLGKYWGQYTALGDTFLENLQGLVTLKIYQSDGLKQREMEEQSERFRRITMKVLCMQLNSITIMDLIAYGGAALGVVLAATQFAAGRITLFGCLLIVLLSADFFLPMRLLGSYFHIAMNGMAASGKIFRLLDLPEPPFGSKSLPGSPSICCRGLRFSYEPGREVLCGVDLDFPQGSFTPIVGESGCGKSTLAGILMGRNRGYEGSVTVNGVELSQIEEASLLEGVTYVGHQSYLFEGTVRSNLLMAKPTAADAELWSVLERSGLAGFLRSEQGLETHVQERAANLSGGQRQRLALARALLHDSPVYLFDEATSNIDIESENDILREICALAKSKSVILISHRLANVIGADNIFVLQNGRVAEQGRHEALLAQKGCYAKLWALQAALENYGREAQL